MPKFETMQPQLTYDGNDRSHEEESKIIDAEAVEVLAPNGESAETGPNDTEAAPETPEPSMDPEVANGIKVLEGELDTEVARVEGNIDHVTMNKYLDAEGQGKYVLAANAYLFAIRDLREVINKDWQDWDEMESVLQVKSDVVIEEQRKFAEVSKELLAHVDSPIEAREAPLQITYEAPPSLLEQLSALLGAAAGTTKQGVRDAKSFRDGVVNYFDTGVPSDKSGAALKGGGGSFVNFVSRLLPWIDSK